MSDTPKATMSEAKCEVCGWPLAENMEATYEEKCARQTKGLTPIEASLAGMACRARGYTRANERAEGMERKLASLRSCGEDGGCGECIACSDELIGQRGDEIKKANLRAEGLAKELEQTMQERDDLKHSTRVLENDRDEHAGALQSAEDDLEKAETQLVAAAARVAEMQDRMIAAFGEGTTAEHLVAISHEHEARVAELEKQLTEVTTELGDAHENGSATAAKWRNRADKAEAELARLRALPDGLREAVREALDGLIVEADEAEPGDPPSLFSLCALCGATRDDAGNTTHATDQACGKLSAALAAPLPSAPLASSAEAPKCALPDGLREALRAWSVANLAHYEWCNQNANPLSLPDPVRGMEVGDACETARQDLLKVAATFVASAEGAHPELLPSAKPQEEICGDACTGKEIPREEHFCSLPAGHLEFHWDTKTGAQWSGGNRRAAENDAPSELASSVAPAVPDTGRSPSAQQVGAAPVDISLGECSAWTAPAPQATPPAQPAGHNPEGVEGKPERVPAEGPPAPGGEK